MVPNPIHDLLSVTNLPLIAGVIQRCCLHQPRLNEVVSASFLSALPASEKPCRGKCNHRPAEQDQPHDLSVATSLVLIIICLSDLVENAAPRSGTPLRCMSPAELLPNGKKILRRRPEPDPKVGSISICGRLFARTALKAIQHNQAISISRSGKPFLPPHGTAHALDCQSGPI